MAELGAAKSAGEAPLDVGVISERAGRRSQDYYPVRTMCDCLTVCFLVQSHSPVSDRKKARTAPVLRVVISSTHLCL